jgi:membrane protease YdiL (CAAX protease family)
VLPFLPAFLLELTLYFASASEQVRSRLKLFPKARVAVLLTLAAAPSYLLYSIPGGTFHVLGLLGVMSLAAVASFWFAVLGRRTAADLGFLVVMAVPVLLKVFETIYPSPTPRIPMQTLGIIMWYRTGLLAVLVVREIEGVGFGLLPRRVDWAIGLKNFLLFLPAGLTIAYVLEFLRPDLPEITPKLLGYAVFYFVGTLWFLAVAEEFVFRGLLQQTLVRMLKSKVAGLVIASILFGCVHLWFGTFPNWRMVLLATVAGMFYGLAYMQAGSIRAAMVTHALVVTLWRVFLA